MLLAIQLGLLEALVGFPEEALLYVVQPQQEVHVGRLKRLRSVVSLDVIPVEHIELLALYLVSYFIEEASDDGEGREHPLEVVERGVYSSKVRLHELSLLLGCRLGVISPKTGDLLASGLDALDRVLDDAGVEFEVAGDEVLRKD